MYVVFVCLPDTTVVYQCPATTVVYQCPVPLRLRLVCHLLLVCCTAAVWYRRPAEVRPESLVSFGVQRCDGRHPPDAPDPKLYAGPARCRTHRNRRHACEEHDGALNVIKRPLPYGYRSYDITTILPSGCSRPQAHDRCQCARCHSFSLHYACCCLRAAVGWTQPSLRARSPHPAPPHHLA
eukprot:COSAG06_NODE_239_length_19404_cov_12.723284_6_plen_181_part_00